MDMRPYLLVSIESSEFFISLRYSAVIGTSTVKPSARRGVKTARPGEKQFVDPRVPRGSQQLIVMVTFDLNRGLPGTLTIFDTTNGRAMLLPHS
jgi:hypothetical protein